MDACIPAMHGCHFTAFLLKLRRKEEDRCAATLSRIPQERKENGKELNTQSAQILTR